MSPAQSPAPTPIPAPISNPISTPISTPKEEWPHLDQQVLRSTRSHIRSRSRSRKVCFTCHWFRHQAGPNCCQGWTNGVDRLRGWAPEVA